VVSPSTGLTKGSLGTRTHTQAAVFERKRRERKGPVVLAPQQEFAKMSGELWLDRNITLICSTQCNPLKFLQALI